VIIPSKKNKNNALMNGIPSTPQYGTQWSQLVRPWTLFCPYVKRKIKNCKFREVHICVEKPYDKQDMEESDFPNTQGCL